MTKKEKLLSRIYCGPWSCALCLALCRLTAAIACTPRLCCRIGQHFHCHFQSSVVQSEVLTYICFRLQLLLHEELGENCQQKWYPIGQQVNGHCWWTRSCVAIACLFFPILKKKKSKHNIIVGRVGLINVFSVWRPLVRWEERINSGIFCLLLSRRSC